MEKPRSNSSHLFQKEAVFVRTSRNASTSKLKALPSPCLPKGSPPQPSHHNLSAKPPTKASPIKDLRQDLLFIPQDFLSEIPNNSFFSFIELHRKKPKLFPVLNYISGKEIQAEEEKKRRDENMTVIDRFFKDMRRDSQRASLSLNVRLLNFREPGQISKELTHNQNQKKMYQRVMEEMNSSFNESLIENYRRSNKKMPPVKVYSTHEEKYERMQKSQKMMISKKNPHKDNNFGSFDTFLNKISFYKYENLFGIKPLASEGSTLSVIEERAYLIGGRGVNFKSEVAYFKLDKKKWKFIKPLTSSPSKVRGMLIRSGHSATVYKNSIVIFGGEKEYNLNSKARQCLSGVEIYNADSNEWKTIFCKGDMPEARKNHISVLIGSQILIYGGLNSFSKCLKDASILDLAKTQWINVEEILDLPPLSGHTGIFVAENDRKFVSLLHSRIDLKSNSPFNHIREEGVYIFGGRNPSNLSTNNLIIIKPGSTPLKVLKPEIKGIAPCPRYNHTMKLFRFINSLIVYGGRNDEMNCCLNDLFALNLEKLAWIKLNTNENRLNDCKSSFASDSYRSRLLVFGGINFKGFLDNDLYVIEFDDNVAKKRSMEQRLDQGADLVTPLLPRRKNEVKTFLPLPVHEANINVSN